MLQPYWTAVLPMEERPARSVFSNYQPTIWAGHQVHWANESQKKALFTLCVANHPIWPSALKGGDLCSRQEDFLPSVECGDLLL